MVLAALGIYFYMSRNEQKAFVVTPAAVATPSGIVPDASKPSTFQNGQGVTSSFIAA